MTLPTKPEGDVDFASSMYWGQGYGTLVDALLEYIPDLTWPLSIRTYSRMRYDPQLKAVMSAYTLPIRRATWSVDGAGCRDSTTAEVADNLGLPVLGKEDESVSGFRSRGFQFKGDHLRLALLDLTFGHMPFCRWYDTGTGVARIAGVSERMPQTIQEIKLTTDGQGQIDWVSQGLNLQANADGVIQSNALVWYVHEREGSNWTGQSLMRASYPAWLIKHELWRVHATSIRRFGMGVPQVNAPAGATPVQIAEAEKLARGFRAGDSSGIGLPNGFSMALQGMVGSVPDALAFIEYLDKQMTRNTLTSLLDLGSTTVGSRALGETFMDLFLMSLQSIADEHADQATQQLVLPLVMANHGEDEACPKIVCGDVGSEHEVTAQTVSLLLASGALSADPALEAYLREQYKLPARVIPWTPPASHSLADPTATVPSGAQAAPGSAPPREPGASVAAAAASGHTGAFIMAKVSAADAARIAVPGGDPADELHVTLAFLDKPAAEYDQAARDRLDAAVAAINPGPITATAFAIATFNADNEPDDDRPPCTVLIVQSAQLAQLHDSVCDVIGAVDGVEEAGDFPTWIPHITLGYNIAPADVPPGRLGDVHFDSIVIGWGGEQHTLTPIT